MKSRRKLGPVEDQGVSSATAFVVQAPEEFAMDLKDSLIDLKDPLIFDLAV